MCGIVGATTNYTIKDDLLARLKQLEYRGYDSAGIALMGDKNFDVYKRTGNVSGLMGELASRTFDAQAGIAHTRWATHGQATRANAHPHLSCDGKIALVHNGIIENFQELKRELSARGHHFVSETDTEVVVHLLEEAYAASGDVIQALKRTCQELIGSWALAVMCVDAPHEIICTRHGSPLLLAQADDGSGSYLASDLVALLDKSQDVYVLEDGQFARLTAQTITVYDQDLNPLEPHIRHISWNLDATDKGDFADYMLKEIYEQPRVIRDTLAGRMLGSELSIRELGMSPEDLLDLQRIYIVACGTSYHAALIAKNLIERWARIPVEVECASEFRYRNPIITQDTMVVAVSQSGETADTLAAMRDCRVRGAKVFGITNVVDSPVAREADGVIYTQAHKEIAVASTKSFTGQVASLTLLALLLAQVKGKMSRTRVHTLFKELADTADAIETILADQSAVHKAALAIKDAHSALFVGRGIASAISYEGALKLKEISYLHAEAYAAGEMKHGPIALIDKGFPVIAVVCDSPTYDKTISNLKECEARGATIIAIASEGNEEIKELADHVIYVPKTDECFTPITATIPLQLLAREVALLRGCNVDQPRNLAKSVTVE